MADKKNTYSFKDKDQKKSQPKKTPTKKQTPTEKFASKPKSKAPSLGTGAAEKAKKAIQNRKKQIDKATR